MDGHLYAPAHIMMVLTILLFSRGRPRACILKLLKIRYHLFDFLCLLIQFGLAYVPTKQSAAYHDHSHNIQL